MGCKSKKIHVIKDESLGGIEREYVEVDRKAKSGNLAIQISDRGGKRGNIGKIERVFNDGSGVILDGQALLHSEYRVLVPAESPQSQDDIIANLVRRVAQLESELTGAKRDIETWAQEVEGLRYTNTELYSRLGYVEQDTDDLDEKVEMCIDDIVTLDERTNLSQEITINVAEFVKLIGGARR